MFVGARRSVVSGLALLGLALVVSLAWGASAQAAITHPYTGVSFGPGGPGVGSFSNPQGVAVDQGTGDVYVYDAGAGAVYKFSAAGAPEDFSALGSNEITGIGGFYEAAAEEIAVDSSAGPDKGDIYVANNEVVRIYSESGSPLGELSGGDMCGVAVDPAGEVYVGVYPETVRRYAPVTNPVTNLEETGSITGVQQVCNVAADSAGDVYAAAYGGGVTKYDALQFGSLSPAGTVVDPRGHTLAVDPTGGDVFIDEKENGIAQYDGSAEPPVLVGSSGASGPGALGEESFGIAVDSTSGEVYVDNAGKVEIFGAGIGVSTEAATGVSVSGATLHAGVEPGGVEVTGCVFEYGIEAGALSQSAPCEPAPPYPGSSSVVAVSAQLSGLSVSTTYHYRVLASNASSAVAGEEEEFTTPGPPSVAGESFSEVGSLSAKLSAEIDPGGGESTTYRVEYGTSTAYGSSTSPVGVGGGATPVAVLARIGELQPNTTYHFRFVAANAVGTATGPDLTFTTDPLGLPGLPDGRGYEMVTPARNEGVQVYAPLGDGGTSHSEAAISTPFPVRAAADGSAVAYVAEPNAEGNGSQGRGAGNEYLARRSPSGGWTQKNMQPAGLNSPKYAGFSADLSTGYLTSSEPLASGVPDGYEVLYTRDSANGSMHPLYTTTPPNRAPAEYGAAGLETFGIENVGIWYAPASPASGRVFFEANDALTPEALDGGETENNIYESHEGALRLVNVLPDGTTEPDAFIGALPTPPAVAGVTAEGEPGNSFHAVSEDGSRVFWTDAHTGALYLRENGALTVLVAEHAMFLTAAADGSRVFYAKAGDLYEDDLTDGVTSDLESGAQVLGIAGASDDASYVYFVAEGVLAPGASPGGFNLYLEHAGATTLVATLGTQENDGGDFGFGERSAYAWAPALGARQAQATPDGHSLVFMSKQSLTGYDNRGTAGFKLEEVFVFNALTGGLSCVSCIPSGERPRSAFDNSVIPLVVTNDAYQLRVISQDGSRVFFQTDEGLVPQDTNGTGDVYEWERDGAGSCRSSSGCIYLLSGGSSASPSFLLDASADGSDVFFITNAQLVGQDENDLYDVYDARVGAVTPPSPPSCTGAGCQGVPASPPVFATPSSATYAGPGNFPASPPAKPAVKPKSKPVKCKKGKKLSHGKCVKKAKAKKRAKKSKHNKGSH